MHIEPGKYFTKRARKETSVRLDNPCDERHVVTKLKYF